MTGQSVKGFYFGSLEVQLKSDPFPSPNIINLADWSYARALMRSEIAERRYKLAEAQLAAIEDAIAVTTIEAFKVRAVDAALREIVAAEVKRTLNASTKSKRKRTIAPKRAKSKRQSLR